MWTRVLLNQSFALTLQERDQSYYPKGGKWRD